MVTSGINFLNFKKRIKSYKIRKNLFNLINENNSIIQSLSKKYKDNFDLNYIKKIDKLLEHPMKIHPCQLF